MVPAGETLAAGRSGRQRGRQQAASAPLLQRGCHKPKLFCGLLRGCLAARVRKQRGAGEEKRVCAASSARGR